MDTLTTEIARLLDGHINNTLTVKEREQWEQWLNEDQNHARILGLIEDSELLFDDIKIFRSYDTARIAESINKAIPAFPVAKVASEAPVHKFSVLNILKYAAVILFIASAGYWIIQNKQKENVPPVAQNNQLVPGTERATLTLSDGRVILLDNKIGGELGTDGNAGISRAGNTVNYQPLKGTTLTDRIAINTMSTPRGGRYALVLSDGTKVWLNASSSITFPSTFTGSDRRVTINGEVYFEVKTDPSHPFIVESKGQSIIVLGTRFNISAYPDEPATISTLLEGSVRVNTNNEASVLKPGQQAIKVGGQLNITTADTTNATAWRTGAFHFSDEDMEMVMQKIARWYDADIVFADQKSKRVKISGVITQFTEVSKVLHMIEETGRIKFTVKDRIITVSATQ